MIDKQKCNSKKGDMKHHYKSNVANICLVILFGYEV